VDIFSQINPTCTQASSSITIPDLERKMKQFEVKRSSHSIRKLKWRGIDFLSTLLAGNFIDMSKIEILDIEQFFIPSPEAGIHIGFWKVEGQLVSSFTGLKHLSILVYNSHKGISFLRPTQGVPYLGITAFVSSLC
jgi:hypothetical protein